MAVFYTKKKVSSLEGEILDLLSISWNKDAFIEELISDIERLKLKVVALENEIASVKKPVKKAALKDSPERKLHPSARVTKATPKK
jgi:hypothetical protein